MGVGIDNMVVPASIANVLTVLIVWGLWAGPAAEAAFGWSRLRVREFPAASHWLMERGMRLIWSASVVAISLWWALWIGRILLGATHYLPFQ